jgi:hypothetical protein
MFQVHALGDLILDMLDEAEISLKVTISISSPSLLEFISIYSLCAHALAEPTK